VRGRSGCMARTRGAKQWRCGSAAALARAWAAPARPHGSSPTHPNPLCPLCPGAELIAGGLASNRALLSLDLAHNCISDMGALALAEALHANTTLTELKLDGNRIGGAAGRQLASS